MTTKRWWPIGATRLIDSEARFNCGQRSISLFPFFNCQGDVQTLLAVDQEAGEVRVVPDALRLKIPLVGVIGVETGWMELSPLDDVHLIDETWHFDPKWKLDEPTLRSHPLRTALKETNCLDDFPWLVDNLYFDGSLRRVKWLHKHTSTENTLTNFKLSHLPMPPSLIDGRKSAVSESRTKGPRWVLNPIWTR